jgi:hypothetical protein
MMGSVVQNQHTNSLSEMDFSEAASAQEQFARLVESTDAMSVYTKYVLVAYYSLHSLIDNRDMFKHTKEQLDRITRTNSSSSILSSLSARSMSSNSS